MSEFLQAVSLIHFVLFILFMLIFFVPPFPCGKDIAKMRVLLLKEPREGESGPDPYIKVKAISLNSPFFLKPLC